MIINDHINLTGKNPLVGGAMVDYGVRFVDMTHAYDKEYIKLINQIAQQQNLAIKNGIYIQFMGPTYETPAEVKMARVLGADTVGMSTTVEVIAGVQCGLRVAGISAVANMASGILDKPLNHKEVLEVMGEVEDKFTKLVLEFLSRI